MNAPGSQHKERKNEKNVGVSVRLELAGNDSTIRIASYSRFATTTVVGPRADNRNKDQRAEGQKPSGEAEQRASIDCTKQPLHLAAKRSYHYPNTPTHVTN